MGIRLIVFLFLNKNICCGYSLEAPQRGASNEYPQHMFLWRNKSFNTFGLKKAPLTRVNYASNRCFLGEIWKVLTFWMEKHLTKSYMYRSICVFQVKSTRLYSYLWQTLKSWIYLKLSLSVLLSPRLQISKIPRWIFFLSCNENLVSH